MTATIYHRGVASVARRVLLSRSESRGKAGAGTVTAAQMRTADSDLRGDTEARVYTGGYTRDKDRDRGP